MDRNDLNAAITAELEKTRPLTKKRVLLDIVQENFKTICFYREENYTFKQIHEAFQNAGLIICSLSHFKACFYKIKRNGIQSTNIRDSFSDAPGSDLPLLRRTPSEKVDESQDEKLGISSQANTSLEGLLESMFGASEHADKNNEEGRNKIEDDISSPPARPSLLTEEMAARMVRDKKLFDEQIRRMGIVRE